MNLPEIVLFDTDAIESERLRAELRGFPFVSVVVGDGRSVTARENLDALWLTWMQATEFGASPPFPFHTARVLPMPAQRVASGLPPYFITGGALAPEDPCTPVFETRLMIRELLVAVIDFNSTGHELIRRVGTVPGNLGLDKLEPGAALRIFEEVFNAMNANTSDSPSNGKGARESGASRRQKG